MLTLRAPSKINLTLEVLGKRPGGYHEISSVIQSVDLGDTLRFSSAEEISFDCDMPGWSAEKSLVSRAVNLMQQTTGCRKGVKISLEKRIPLLSGLGGDSSDAAAALKGLNDLWQLNLSHQKLRSLAAQIGSDVSFFLRGGTALASGRGQVIQPLPAPAPMWVVLIFPGIPVEPGKTGRLYAALTPSHFTDGSITQEQAENIRKRRTIAPSLLFNTFENVAFNVFPGLSVYKEHLMSLGAAQVHLAGSGPALFSILQDKTSAEELCKKAPEHHASAYLVDTL